MVPYALGYFADEGLDVGIQQSGGSKAAFRCRLGERPMGPQTATAWKQLQEYDLKGALISQPQPVADFFTNEFEAKMNDFDVEAIKNQARHFNVGMIKYWATK